MLGALFGFKGRLSRPGYWEVLASIVLIDVALLLGRMTVADGGAGTPLRQALLNATPWVIVIFTGWSLLAAAVKRFHDRDRSGLMIVVGLIPVIGWLWLLVDLFVLEGTEGRNRYGWPPHAAAPEPRSRFSWDPEPSALAMAPATFEAPAYGFHESRAEPPAPDEAPTPADGEHGDHGEAEPALEETHLQVQEAAPTYAEPEPHFDEEQGGQLAAEPELPLVYEEAPAELHDEAHELLHEDQVLDITSDPVSPSFAGLSREPMNTAHRESSPSSVFMGSRHSTPGSSPGAPAGNDGEAGSRPAR